MRSRRTWLNWKVPFAPRDAVLTSKRCPAIWRSVGDVREPLETGMFAAERYRRMKSSPICPRLVLPSCR